MHQRLETIATTTNPENTSQQKPEVRGSPFLPHFQGENDEPLLKENNEKVLHKDEETLEKPEDMEATRKEHEITCDICKGKYRGKFKKHKRTETHRQIARKKQEQEKLEKKRQTITKNGTEVYKVRVGSGENQQYINTLATFIAVRCILDNTRDFKISINSDEWNDFGDVVFEFVDAKIEAISCKKVGARKNYTTTVLIAGSGNLSLREQSKVLKELQEKDKFAKANFKLCTVSNVSFDQHAVFTGGDSWNGVQLEIKQPNRKAKDIFNTTDDSEDILLFNTLNHPDSTVNQNMSKFQMYINQKTIPELLQFVKMLINDQFNADFDISDDLVRFVKQKFKTDKDVKPSERRLKVTREDVSLKIAELLLEPFLVLPDHIIGERNLDQWNDTVTKFDVTFVKDEEDLIAKIYKGLNHVLKRETKYTLGTGNEVHIKDGDITSENLKTKLMDNDRSLKFFYLAMWKAGLTPLVLRAESHKSIEHICDVVSFLKGESLRLSFIVATNLKPARSCFSTRLAVFLSMEDLKLLEKQEYDRILSKKISILNRGVTLREIVDLNGKFLSKQTPDVFLNMLCDEYSFVNIQGPITEEIVDNTIVVDEEVIQYLSERQESVEGKLSYLVNVSGQVRHIQVPPEL